MAKIIVYIATSKDGYIADEKGNVDWLPQTLEETGGQDYGYQEFYASVDAIVIGRKTYDQILGFGEWPYPGKTSYIFSRSPKESVNSAIQFEKDVPDFIRRIRERDVKKVWIVGGAELIDAFYKAGGIDEFLVTIFPSILNGGVALPALERARQSNQYVHVKSIDYGAGVSQEHLKMI